MTPKLGNCVRGLVLAVAASAALLAPQPAHAVKFANQFVEFELPYGWKCGLEGAEWVCQSEDANKKRDAIIVLAAKLKGDQDTLDKYQEYLNKPRKFSSAGGKDVVSQPKYANNKTVNGHVWVDSMHMSSEIPDFFTRYMATIEKDIAVLVTYSVNKTKFADYQKQFDDMITSLKVFRKQGGINQMAQSTGGTPPGVGVTGGIFDKVAPTDNVAQTAASTKSGGGGAAGGAGVLILVALGAVGFIIWKKKKAAGG